MALLRRGDLSVTEVCFAVGCAVSRSAARRWAPSHAFKELVGVPPSVYRDRAALVTVGMPPCVAKQVTKPIRNREASQSMPPYGLWLRGRDDIFAWWVGPGIGCKGSRVVATVRANGSPAFGQYKPDPDGGYSPWALQVLETSHGRITEFTFFLDTERLFPAFGLPDTLDP